MKILNVSAQKPDSTGSGVYLAQTVRCELAAGHEAAVVCGIDADEECVLPQGAQAFPVRFNTDELPFDVVGMSDEMPYPATRYRDLTPRMTWLFMHAFARRIEQARIEFRPDVIVCHHLYLVTAVASVCAEDEPVFAVCHSTDLRQMRAHDLQRFFILNNIRDLAGIFALHEAQAAEIVKMYGCEPGLVQVLGTGYDAAVFHCDGRRAANDADAEAADDSQPDAQDDRELSVLYAGKIWTKKGVLSLLEAFDLLECGGSARLLLAGGAGEAAEYERIANRAARCTRPVELLGRLTPEALAERYRAADVFVLPSFYEGLPLVVVEALACGCRVVVTDLPGIRPWLERALPGAPIVYVTPPRMIDVDTPREGDLPAFEQRLARAIEQAAALPPCTLDMSALSWEGLTARLVDAMRPFAQ